MGHRDELARAYRSAAAIGALCVASHLRDTGMECTLIAAADCWAILVAIRLLNSLYR
jgi:hypothetical protein